MIEGRGGSGKEKEKGVRKVTIKVFVMKGNENDNILYCGEYLSVNSG